MPPTRRPILGLRPLARIASRPRQGAPRALALDLYTDRARQALTLAQDEARRLRHGYVGTEHVLLGLLREDAGMAGRLLVGMDVGLPAVRAAVESIVGLGLGAPVAELPLTPRAKKALALAVAEADRLHHHYLGTEHLLLGILREGEGVAATILGRLGVTLEAIRADVARTVGTGG